MRYNSLKNKAVLMMSLENLTFPYYRVKFSLK